MKNSHVSADALKEVEEQIKSSSEVSEKKNPLSIEHARVILNTEQHLYSAMLQNCRLCLTTRVPTAGVRISGSGQVELSINPNFWNSLEGYEGVGLLMHEMLHILYEHLTWGATLDQKIANYAMDITINQFIPKHWLPKGGLLPQMKYPDKLRVRPQGAKKGEYVEIPHPKAGQFIWNFEQGRSFPIYYAELIKLREERKKLQKPKTKQTEEEKKKRQEEKKKKEEEKKKQQEQIKEIIAQQKQVEEAKAQCLKTQKETLVTNPLSVDEMNTLKSEQKPEIMKQNTVLKTQDEINSLLEKLRMKEPRALSQDVKNSQSQVQSEMVGLYE